MIHFLGSSMLIIFASYIIVDAMHNKKQTWSSLAGRLLLVLVIFITLLR